MKHRWLYLHTLDTVEAVRKIATQYVSDVNELIPRVELGGRTPDEAYRGEVPDLEQELREAGVAAREARMTTNRETSCATCRPADGKEGDVS